MHSGVTLAELWRLSMLCQCQKDRYCLRLTPECFTPAAQASRSMSDSFALGRSLDSAPTDGSAARSADERKAQLLGFLQKSHLLETSQVSTRGHVAMRSIKRCCMVAGIGGVQLIEEAIMYRNFILLSLLNSILEASNASHPPPPMTPERCRLPAQALAALPAMGSAALSAAAARAASTQSSMDLVTAENIAAALPDLAQTLTDNGGQRPGSSAAPVTCSGFPPGKPPAFPQVCGILYIAASPFMLLQLRLPDPSAQWRLVVLPLQCLACQVISHM